MSPFHIYEREITVLGSKAILHTFPSAVDTVRRHGSPLRPLLSCADYPLNRFEVALAMLQSGLAVKVVIQPEFFSLMISKHQARKSTYSRIVNGRQRVVYDLRSTEYQKGIKKCQSLRR